MIFYRGNPSKTLGITQRFEEGDRLKLSTKGRYGLRALIDLAQYSEDTPVSIMSISSRQELSERYLEQLMSMLKKAGLVKSIRGAGGGYILAKPAYEWEMYSVRWKEAWNRWTVRGWIRKAAAKRLTAV